ncbi:helix-turn-helix domain-containing protein, partial [Azospirillum sp. SYSU D00513]|uniref:helix-turn-helix domain-containing protein n=1 Tax=Azospirillum sp. SYSU D00513 TaxID=2812561 RepID=UPI001A974EEE
LFPLRVCPHRPLLLPSPTGRSRFQSNRLSAAVDVLGYASYQTADDAILKLAKTQPFGRVLSALAEKAMRNVDLAADLEKDEAQVSKWLTILREQGAVTSHKRGREVFNALTPVGRLVVEQGLQNESRALLKDGNVVSLDANRYDLSKRPIPADVRRAPLPRISACN